MKRRTLLTLLSVLIIIGTFLTTRNDIFAKPKPYNQVNVITVDDTYKVAKDLSVGEISNEEYAVSGKVIDNPTPCNDLGFFSFYLGDNKTDKKIIIFLADSEENVYIDDSVVVLGHIKRVNATSVELVGSNVTGIEHEPCSVLSVIHTDNLGITLFAETETVTMLEITTYLSAKSEHYPFSDEFIERYQQTGGGYLDTAKKAGRVIDRQLHEPNQKWHFFVSWYEASLADGTVEPTDSAKTCVYTRLQCPELNLWIYEACGVSPVKVKAAKQAAEVGKTSGLATSSIAKHMRDCVAWEDIENNLRKVSVDATSVTLDKTVVSIEKGNADVVVTASVLPANTTQAPQWSVVSGNDVISINTNNNQLTIHPIKEGNARVRVAYNSNVSAECVVTVTDDHVSTITINEHQNCRVLRDSIEISNEVIVNDGESFIFSVEPSDGYVVKSVSVNDNKLTANEGLYSFVVDEDAIITIKTKTESIGDLEPTSYEISYDLNGGKSAKKIGTIEALVSTFILADGENIIESITGFENIYGGGNGGSGENSWSSGDMLKVGTTSVNGYMTFLLAEEVDYVIITGYIHGSNCKISVDDSGAVSPTITTCNSMTIVSLDNINTNNTSSIELRFEKTDSVKIATTNKKPLYITSIEFGVYTEE